MKTLSILVIVAGLLASASIASARGYYGYGYGYYGYDGYYGGYDRAGGPSFGGM